MTRSPSPYGLHRSIEPSGEFPQLAWRLDVSTPRHDNEIEIAVDRLHIDASSFRQLRAEYGSEERIGEAILALVADRGKMHNPRTNSGGILIGHVRSAGPGICNPPAQNARIASLVSLTLTPLRLLRVIETNIGRCELRVEGTAYLFQSSAWALVPKDLPEAVSLAAFDVAGAPARVRMRCRPGDRVVIVGAGRSGVLSAVAASDAGASDILLIDIDATRLAACERLGIQGLKTLQADARDTRTIEARLPEKSDLTISCVDVAGVEPTCLLATKQDGHVLFFSMVTDFARAALCAEGLGSAATLEIGNGFVAAHAEYVISIMRRHPLLRELFESPPPASDGL